MNHSMEWLEADGLGGFASGTANGIRTRRYHALLLTATTPPTGRLVLVNGFDAWVETVSGAYPLTSQSYTPEVVHPDGVKRIESFEPEPWPRWRFRLEDGAVIEHELFAVHDSPTVVTSWRLVNAGSVGKIALFIRPFLSGRDYHSLHHENGGFRFDAGGQTGKIIWQPYASLPKIVAITNGSYEHKPEWYRNFSYSEERDRGLDFTEDLASPGILRFDIGNYEAALIFTTDENLKNGTHATKHLEKLRVAEHKRRSVFPSRLHRAADAYIVRRGRNTLRLLCSAT